MERGLFREEHLIFREAFKKFLDKEIAPYYPQWERNGIVPKEVWRKAGEQGFLCPWVEETYGGAGAGLEYSIIMAEEMSRQDFVGFAHSLHCSNAWPQHGNRPNFS